MKIKNIATKLLTLFCSILLVTGCSSEIVDNSLKTEHYIVNESKVEKQHTLLEPELSSIYSGIDDMYRDSDYVVSAIVKDVEFFEVKHVLLRKINVLINKSYKGNITKNTLISVLENDGYLRLKSLYADSKKYYIDNNGDKEKEAEWLDSVTHGADIKDIENDMLIKSYYPYKKDSKIGDKLLLFMSDSSDDTYKDKTVRLFGSKLSYPKGAYATVGNGLGKFTLNDNTYQRYNLYYTPNGTIKGLQTTTEGTVVRGIPVIKKSYTVKEMEDELKKLK